MYREVFDPLRGPAKVSVIAGLVMGVIFLPSVLCSDAALFVPVGIALGTSVMVFAGCIVAAIVAACSAP